MLINGIDISSLGVKLYDRILNSNSIYTVDDWLDGDIQPTNIRQQEKFRQIKLSFLVLGTNEQDAFHRISRLTKELKQATIIFDDINLAFDVSIIGAADTKRLKNGNFIVTYILHSDYAKGDREIYTTNANLTNAFKLNLLYYQNQTQLISSESITIRASNFTGVNDTLTSIGIDLDKYLPDYYNHGMATNMNGLEVNYSNLQYLGTLIINYSPIQYNLALSYMMDDGTGFFNEILQETITFTYPQLQTIQTIGQLIKPQRYKPEGYKSNITFTGDLTVENILALSPIQVLYEKIENARTKNILVSYCSEDDMGDWHDITTQIVNVTETQFYDGVTLQDLFNVDAYRPDQIHYNNGYFVDHNNNELVNYDTVELNYSIHYPRLENIIFVEYYAGVYPGWYRIATATITSKYKDAYANNFSISQLGIDVNRYHTSTYQNGAIYNTGSLDTYDNIINAGVIQIYYTPIDYDIVVNFYTEGTAEPNTQTFTINALDFFNDPVLTDLIPVGTYKPNGYQFDPSRSYDGEITLAALTQASPINIMFEEIEADRTKNILIHYKQELASVFSSINTSLITINESDCVGGVRLKDIINLDLYRPTYYETGMINGYSANALLQYNDILSEYDVLYAASTYSTPVRYYTDDVDDQNWIGSSSISYRIIDFETTTTLYDLGLNVNAFKPSYCDDGDVQYHGAVNFLALRDTESIDIVYDTIDEPTEDDGIDYPHRFLFLQHNDLGDYEGLHPEWTMNHAFINTGVTAADMSKLTVIMECKRVDNNVPLHTVNGAYGYLFGSHSGYGSYFMRFNNQTQYHSGELTGVNTYEAKAGYYSNLLVITEDQAIGWSENSGIYASARDGYSNATFTYTNPVQTEPARMVYPLYLFANNNAGSYEFGLAGIGIYGCRIYYDNVLIRDYIPVQFYDKIGDQVAPSNCLYDKVTKTFFEDATGMNSFNIIDDDRYEDDNPEHKIGFCYVNYYQNGVRFKTNMYYFRASDFIDQTYDPYTKWQVDENQPAYYKPGVITDFANIDRSFNGLNNHTFSVNYEEDENQIVVNYYTLNNSTNETELIATDTIVLKEKDFYQVPTFGDIVRLNKYKPDGYQTNYQFPEPKVSLSRVLSHSPYSIVYTRVSGQLHDYTTTIRYIKKVYGIRTYETIQDITLHLDETDFRDGEYIDFYIDKNAAKPASFYKDGEYYQWYEMDERLTSPEDLKEVYIICYDCETVHLPVNYYTDEWHEDNLIASTTWSFRLDDFDPTYPFYLVDQLPNTYINKYRPANCDGGVLQNSNQALTFLELSQLEEIAIVYDTIAEPHDPTEAYYEKKVLYWGDLCNRIYPSYDEITKGINAGTVIEPWRIPYIDLGYTPKEIGRLRVEFTGASKPIGVQAPTNGYSFLDTGYTSIFGYAGPPAFTATPEVSYERTFYGQDVALPSEVITNEYETLMEHNGGLFSTDPLDEKTIAFYKQLNNKYDNLYSKGYFYIKPRMPSTTGANWIYTYNGPSSIDGQKYTDNVMAQANTHGFVYYIQPGMRVGFRRGCPVDTDENYETIPVFNDYKFYKEFRSSTIEPKETDGFMQVNSDRFQAAGLNSYDDTKQLAGQDGTWVGDYGFANPFTIVLDAYNNYCSIWNYSDSNTPFSWEINNTDNPIWEDIERPRGSLSLFTTTNPSTGRPNYLDNIYWAYPSLGAMSGAYSVAFQNQGMHYNPYKETADSQFEITYEVDIIASGASPAAGGGTTTDAQGHETGGNESISSPVVTRKIISLNANFSNWVFPTFPWQAGGIIWGIKIYDQDRLVRDLIPVAQGDQIYDYVMPDDGLFDLVTEIFFGNSNPGRITTHTGEEKVYVPARLYAIPDILSYGKITTNYYDYDNSFIGNKFVDVPTWFCGSNTTIEEILEWNDYKPDDYHLDGWLDVDQDWSWIGNKMNLAQIYEMNSVNIYYRLRTFTKTVVYYRGNVRVGSRDIMYSLEDIQNAHTLSGLGINVDLYYDSHFKHGRIVYNEQIIADDDIEAFINAPSPIVVYDKLTRQEAPNLLYVEYYRGGAYDNNLITLDENDNNYLNCDLTARVLNPYGAIKYYNHYHQAMYEDENFGEFIPYQVHVLNRYVGLHAGPARRYKTLAMIVERDTYTIIQERNGWGRLKEYPNAWILLTATEPITGPGQNPEYDVAGEEVATIPFGEYIDITRLTIDRLWAYVPDVDSWVKTEDISFNQAGKLFNGLKIEVIDLGDINFNSVSAWTDIVDKDKYMLRFHNAGSADYNGAATYNALSLKHTIEIVYPETIYNYSCIYYKDNKSIDDSNRLGAAAFSCTISDWNPDWDTFISTSWQRRKIYGKATVKNPLSNGTIALYSDKDINSSVVYSIPNGDEVDVASLGEEVGDKIWYAIHYIDYDGYIRSTNLTITENYGGEADISPTLYRDTVLTLTWDYFGFMRNLFKPTGYGNGIYLWNPRSWDKDNVKFSFEELIRCGTQYVVYPIFNADTYKIWVQGNWVGSSRTYTISEGNYQTWYMNNPGIKIDMTKPDNQAETKFLYTTPHYSIYASGEWRNDLGFNTNMSSMSGYFFINRDKNAYYNTRIGNIRMQNAYHLAFDGFVLPFTMNFGSTGEYDNITPDALKQIKNGDMLIGEYSNYRYSPTGVAGIGNAYENREIDYYAYGLKTKLQDATNITNYHYDPPIPQSSIDNNTYTQDELATLNASALDELWCRGVIYDAIGYYDNMMIHYYVPVPKGLRYRYNGANLRIPENGLFDLLTGEFKGNFKAADYTGQVNNPLFPAGFENITMDGKDFVFLRNQQINETDAYDIFQGWQYTTISNPALFKVNTNKTVQSYKDPDAYSAQMALLTSNLIIPVSLRTSDSSHNVSGIWYKTGNEWFQYNSTLVTSRGSISNKYTEYNATCALVPGTYRNFYVYNNPEAGPSLNSNSDYSYGSTPSLVKVYYRYQYANNDARVYYFDGQHWIPEQYTSLWRLEHNKNYVLTQDTALYEYPIEDNEYRIRTLLYGDRITILQVCRNNQNWGYTGNGWIYLTGNTSLIE